MDRSTRSLSVNQTGLPFTLVTISQLSPAAIRHALPSGMVMTMVQEPFEEGALAGRGLELAWAADPIELFFLQIQGSGRLRLPDGSVMRIGYANQNGRE